MELREQTRRGRKEIRAQTHIVKEAQIQGVRVKKFGLQLKVECPFDQKGAEGRCEYRHKALCQAVMHDGNIGCPDICRCNEFQPYECLVWINKREVCPKMDVKYGIHIERGYNWGLLSTTQRIGWK